MRLARYDAVQPGEGGAMQEKRSLTEAEKRLAAIEAESSCLWSGCSVGHKGLWSAHWPDPRQAVWAQNNNSTLAMKMSW